MYDLLAGRCLGSSEPPLQFAPDPGWGFAPSRLQQSPGQSRSLHHPPAQGPHADPSPHASTRSPCPTLAFAALHLFPFLAGAVSCALPLHCRQHPGARAEPPRRPGQHWEQGLGSCLCPAGINRPVRNPAWLAPGEVGKGLEGSEPGPGLGAGPGWLRVLMWRAGWQEGSCGTSGLPVP